MKVESLMTHNVESCAPGTDLATAARHMWDADCGLLPVLDAGKLRGVVTDRDIAMAVAMRGVPARDIRVDEIMTGDHVTVRAQDDAKVALEKMSAAQVRRLPVVGKDGELDGVLSMNDLMLEAKAARNAAGAPTYKQIVIALQAIGQHRDLPVAATG